MWISEPKPHRINTFASVPLIPKFAHGSPPVHANCGIGTLGREQPAEPFCPGNSGRPQTFQPARNRKGRSPAADSDQTAAQREPFAPEMIDHRVIGGGA